MPANPPTLDAAARDELARKASAARDAWARYEAATEGAELHAARAAWVAARDEFKHVCDFAVILALLAAVERGAEDTRDAEPTIREMQAINAARSARWMAGSPGWTTLEIAGELAGEVGELANVCKKLRRSEMGVPGNKVSDDVLRQQARSEMADVFIVLMLTASKLGVDLYEAVCDTFNAKSEQMGFPERFPTRVNPEDAARRGVEDTERLIEAADKLCANATPGRNDYVSIVFNSALHRLRVAAQAAKETNHATR